MSWRIHLSGPHLGAREHDLLATDDPGDEGAAEARAAFEARVAGLAGRRHAVALASGPAALRRGLLGLGVGPGDEVWCAGLGPVATAEAVLAVGASPVFVDVEDRRWTMDPTVLARALDDAAGRGRPPAAVVPSDLYATVADHDAIVGLAAARGVPVLVDSSSAVGAKGDGGPAGSAGDAAVLAFDPEHIVTTGGGGVLVTDDGALADRVRGAATHGRAGDPGPWSDDAPLSGRRAAVGLSQLEVLPDRIARRREINARYRRALDPLPGLEVWPVHPGSTRWLTLLLVDRAEAGVGPGQLQRTLDRRRIEARRVHEPLHTREELRGHRAVGGAVAEYLSDRGLCLPSSTSMTDEDVDEVADLVARLVTG